MRWPPSTISCGLLVTSHQKHYARSANQLFDTFFLGTFSVASRSAKIFYLYGFMTYRVSSLIPVLPCHTSRMQSANHKYETHNAIVCCTRVWLRVKIKHHIERQSKGALNCLLSHSALNLPPLPQFWKARPSL